MATMAKRKVNTRIKLGFHRSRILPDERRSSAHLLEMLMLTTRAKNSMNLVFTDIDPYCYNWRLDVRWYNNDNWVTSNLGRQHKLQQRITVFDETFKQLHVIVKSALTFRLYNLTNVHFIDYSRDVHKIDSRLSEFSSIVTVWSAAKQTVNKFSPYFL